MTDAVALPAGPLQAAFRSDPGRVRTNNEDLPLVDAARGVFGVIDGVGGSAAGEVAAAIAREVILQRLSRPLGTPRERVREAIAIANNEIYRRAERSAELHGMSCVITLAILSGDVITVGHVGDSRLYTIGPAGLRKLTHDHSPVGEREDAGEITEGEAMRHPRRNELFRDVGAALRDKDDEDFVEVIEAPWEPGQALLLCTDGLTDMVPAATIDRIVRRHAGSPQAVADALVDAANEAGGRDNVTVVYAEGAGFVAWARRAGAGANVNANANAGETQGRQSWTSRLRSLTWRGWLGLAAFALFVIRSRTTWFAVGALAGVLAALQLAWQVRTPGPPVARTVPAGAAVPGAVPRIADALAAARPGDTVRLEPGVYAERILVPDGVDLVARVPGTVTLRRPAGNTGEWVAITAAGTEGGRLAGIRVESTSQAPVDVGVRVSGHGRTIEMFDIVGAVQSAIEVLPASSLVLSGCVLEVPALAVRLHDGAQATLANNIVSRVGRARSAPVSLGPSARVVLSRNVLHGFGAALVEPAPTPGQVELAGNFVIPAPPRGTR